MGVTYGGRFLLVVGWLVGSPRQCMHESSLGFSGGPAGWLVESSEILLLYKSKVISEEPRRGRGYRRNGMEYRPFSFFLFPS